MAQNRCGAGDSAGPHGGTFIRWAAYGRRDWYARCQLFEVVRRPWRELRFDATALSAALTGHLFACLSRHKPGERP
eukprot:851772-Pleurochrysis_carterae.AAC.1